MGDDLHINKQTIFLLPIIGVQNVLERKDSMTECYQRASERACVTFPLFGQGITTFFFLSVTVIIQLVSRDHVCRFENGSQMAE
jgi:hypothetical protein